MSLGNALVAGAPIEELNLDENCIGVGGARHLGICVKHNRILRLLSLCCNEVGDSGAFYLAELVRSNRTVNLRLRGNGITRKGMSYFPDD